MEPKINNKRMETDKISNINQIGNFQLINQYNLEKEEVLKSLPLNIKVEAIKDYLTSLQNTYKITNTEERKFHENKVKLYTNFITVNYRDLLDELYNLENSQLILSVLTNLKNLFIMNRKKDMNYIEIAKTFMNFFCLNQKLTSNSEEIVNLIITKSIDFSYLSINVNNNNSTINIEFNEIIKTLFDQLSENVKLKNVIGILKFIKLIEALGNSSALNIHNWLFFYNLFKDNLLFTLNLLSKSLVESMHHNFLSYLLGYKPDINLEILITIIIHIYSFLRQFIVKIKNQFKKFNLIEESLYDFIPISLELVLTSINNISYDSLDSDKKILLISKLNEKNNKLLSLRSFFMTHFDKFDIEVNTYKTKILIFLNTLLVSINEFDSLTNDIAEKEINLIINLNDECKKTEIVEVNHNDNKLKKLSGEMQITLFNSVMIILNDLKLLIVNDFNKFSNTIKIDKTDKIHFTLNHLIMENLLFCSKIILFSPYIQHFEPHIKNIITEIIYPLSSCMIDEYYQYENEGESYFNYIRDSLDKSVLKNLKSICSGIIKNACNHYDGLANYIICFSIEAVVVSASQKIGDNSMVVYDFDEANNYLTNLFRKTNRFFNSELLKIISNTSIIENSFFIICLLNKFVLNFDNKIVVQKFFEDYIEKIISLNCSILMDRLCLFISIFSEHFYEFSSIKMSNIIGIIMHCLLEFKEQGIIQTSSHAILQIFRSDKSYDYSQQQQIIQNHYNRLLEKLSVTDSCIFLEAFYTIIFNLNNSELTLKIIDVCVKRLTAHTKKELNKRFQVFKVSKDNNVDLNSKTDNSKDLSLRSNFVNNKLLNIVRLLVATSCDEIISNNLNALESALWELFSFSTLVHKIDFDEDLIEIAANIVSRSKTFTKLQSLLIKSSLQIITKYKGLNMNLFLYMNSIIVNVIPKIEDFNDKRELYDFLYSFVEYCLSIENPMAEFSEIYSVHLLISCVLHCNDIPKDILFKMLTYMQKNLISSIPLQMNNNDYFDNNNKNSDNPYFFVSITTFFYSCFINYSELTFQFLCDIKNDSFNNEFDNCNTNLNVIKSHIHVSISNRVNIQTLYSCVEIIVSTKEVYNSYLMKLIIIGISALLKSFNEYTFNHVIVEKYLYLLTILLQIQSREESELLKANLKSSNSLSKKFIKRNNKIDVNFSDEENNSDNESYDSIDFEGDYEDDLLNNNTNLKEKISKAINQKNINDEKYCNIQTDMKLTVDKEALNIMIKNIDSEFKKSDEFANFKKSIDILSERFGDFLLKYINNLSNDERIIFHRICKTSRIKLKNFKTEDTNSNDNEYQRQGIFKNTNDTNDEQMVPRRVVKIKKTKTVKFD